MMVSGNGMAYSATRSAGGPPAAIVSSNSSLTCSIRGRVAAMRRLAKAGATSLRNRV